MEALMKTLVIAEKPSVARDLAHVLRPGTRKSPDRLEAEDMVFTWALGHLLSLEDAEGYDPRYRVWRLEDLPIIPAEMKYRALKATTGHLKAVAALMKRADIDVVVNACDAGREGELIFREISRFAGLRKPVQRLWLSETTPEAIKRAYAAMLPQAHYENLAAAAFLRQEADWLVGINASRVFSVRHKQRLSVGRVQTPTLALLVAREEEIENFTPQTFYQLHATFETTKQAQYRGMWVLLNDQGEVAQDRFQTREDVAQHQYPLPRQAVVRQAQKSTERELPPLLPNLSDIQREANRLWGLTAAKTLAALQGLYEKGYISYPRTESRHLTKSLAGSLGSRLKALEATDLAPQAQQALQNLEQFRHYGKRYVDDAKVTDHHAMIVTTKVPAGRLGSSEESLYRLIARHFLAAFFPPALFSVYTVLSEDVERKDMFRSTQRQRQEEGFQVLFPPAQDPNKKESTDELPTLHEGERVTIVQYDVHEGVTKPPVRYTEAALLGAMERAGKKIDDPALKDAMKTAGLGTAATRAAIIERLITVGYVEREKKQLVPTDKGKTLVTLVPDLLTQVTLTAQWEDGLRAVEEGRAAVQEFRQAIHGFTREVVEQARSAPVNEFAVLDEETLYPCPLCASPLQKFSKGYRCTKQKDTQCAFILWTTIASKTLTPRQVQTLLTKGRTGTIRGFKSKAGKSFQAALVLENGKVRFDFDQESATAKKVPRKRKAPSTATKKAGTKR